MQRPRRILTSASGPFTCLACRARPPPQRRAFSRSVPRYAAPAAPSPSGIARLTSRKLISVSGPDAAKYLQGVITANLYPGGSTHPGGDSEHLRSDPGFYAAFLTAQGRVLHDVFLYHDVRDRSHPRGHSWLVEVDAAEAERLQKHIRRYKLRAKFDVRVLDDADAAVWHLWSDDDTADQQPSIIFQHLLLPSADKENQPLAITTRDPRAPNLGHRLILFGDNNPKPQTPLPLLDESSYRLRRYLHGIPEGQAELPYGQALPHESNMDLTGATDFRKGCYVGQELTIRTEHRGVVRKRVLPVLLYPEEDEAVPGLGLGLGSSAEVEEEGGEGILGRLYRPQIGTGDGNRDVGGDVVDAEMVPAEASIGRVGKKGRSAGKWLSGVGNVGLALCRLEIMTDVLLPGETGGVGFSEGGGFVVGLDNDDGRRVKVKAFVPQWLRKGLAGKEGH
ncbi:Aminomethyltransferase folate-binding domain-containing protein [Parathielavia hyrcaniae]|uniref:Iron-sulfur cluster assembly factor IBA57 homolog, mitochondrial n=1 Tax=Parathielavia hyrcaniae TaxID=113614 RepID=A0AAN6T7J8_9PEZI|nr:Aminomethyltransferase folate-binding domain-containing protein [Parathielavia hyrcaniae]